MNKISMLERKILVELDKNSRQSMSQLAKKIKTSQQVISYNINKLLKDGIIKNFRTELSTRSIGLPLIIKCYIQLKGATENKEKEILNYLLSHKDVNWVCKTLGEFDIFTAVMVKDIDSLGKFKEQFFKEFGDNISIFEVSFINKGYVFARNYLIDEPKEVQKSRNVHESIKETLDEKDRRIIKEIIDNARLSIVEISKKTGLNIKTIVERIKKLEKSGVIQGYGINIDPQKIGMKFYKIFIKLNSFAKNKYDWIINSLLKEKYTLHLIECIGKYEIEIEAEIPESQNLQEIIKTIRNSSPESIERVEAVEIISEIKLSWLPKSFFTSTSSQSTS